MTKARAALVLTLGLSAAAGGCDSGGAGNPSATVEATCARISACGFDGSMPLGFGTCEAVLIIFRAAPASSASGWKRDRALIDCFFGASSCDEMQACLGVTPARAALCDNVTTDVCDGNTLISCGDRSSGTLTAFDCSTVGLTCAIGPSGDGTCGLGSCDPLDVRPRCDGDLLVTCESQYDALVSQDCRLSGKTCGTDSAGQAVCKSDVACDPATSRFRCDGTVEVVCEDGTESRHDCAMFGADFTCHTESYTNDDHSETTSSIDCIPAGKDCELGDAESCTGSVISYCKLGRRGTYDCRAAGFTACATQVSGSTTIAVCAP